MGVCQRGLARPMLSQSERKPCCLSPMVCTTLIYSSPLLSQRLPGELGFLPDLEQIFAENNWLSTLPKELAMCRLAGKGFTGLLAYGGATQNL